ncbi:hypothetical protein E2C01_011187 [Portunus trituberculatus]|uniref:Uncharacterized protein n=1 Tax=Portunus trituberculatus TaxID=210409 RepID=A0A5B7DAE4_PORTR|nr:hypothetical protein [Portunus trituberculatus]
MQQNSELQIILNYPPILHCPQTLCFGKAGASVRPRKCDGSGKIDLTSTIFASPNARIGLTPILRRSCLPSRGRFLLLALLDDCTVPGWTAALPSATIG